MRPYFQANPVLVMTDQPIKKSINKPKAIGRMIQWALKLCQFNVKYHPKTAIKAQALANFITEFTVLNEEGTIDEMERWTIQTDALSI